MSFLSTSELAALEIEHMIFHVIVKGKRNLRYYAEVPVGDLDGFFLERIAIANQGIRYSFTDDSQCERTLREIRQRNDYFGRGSRELAKRFHGLHRGKASDGLFMFFQLKCEGKTLFSIIKYDRQDILRYRQQVVNGERTLSLTSIRNALVRNKDAMQKSALIRLSGAKGGELSVIDRVASRAEGTMRYFQKFLGVQRNESKAELTKKLLVAARNVATKHRHDLDPAFGKDVETKLRKTLASGMTFDPADRAGFLNSVYGPTSEESPWAKTFDGELKKARIEHEPFEVDVASVPRVTKRRIKFVEDIELSYRSSLRGRIDRQPQPGGGVVVTIRSAGIEIDDIVLDDDSEVDR